MSVSREVDALTLSLAPATADALRALPHRVRRSPAAVLLRHGVTPWLVGVDVSVLAGSAALTGVSPMHAALLTLLVLWLNQLGGLYSSRLTLSLLDDLPSLLGRGVVAGSVSLAITSIQTPLSTSTHLIRTSLVFVGLAAVGRSVAYAVVRLVRSRGLVRHPALILGAGKVGGQLASTLLQHPEYGLMPVGFLDPDPLLAPHQRPIPLLGGLEALGDMIQAFDVSEVIIAFGAERESSLIDVLRTCDRLRCEIFLVPRLFEMHSGGGLGVDSVWGMPLVRMRRATYRTPSWHMKRVLDIAVAGLALVLTAPLLAVIAAAVRFETGPRVLFRQERVGLDGRRFNVLKFRTLVPVDDEESATVWSIAEDHRLGRIGKFLRKSSLDELPQLWNVLTGEMSLVGPRPERPHFVEGFARAHPRYVHRHRVPAGLTGWAQVHGLRGDTSISDRAAFDNFYVENWSLWLDLKILLRTVLSLVRGAG